MDDKFIKWSLVKNPAWEGAHKKDSKLDMQTRAHAQEHDI